MPTFEVTDELGRTLVLEGDTPPTDADLDLLFADYDTYRQELGQQQTAIPEPEPDPFADQRTATGQAFETIKGVGRGFGGSFLTAAEGLAELADAGTNALGYEDLIDSGDENALVKAARSGQESIQDAIGADRAYQDTWLTKFGEGLGSFASFFTPAGVAKGVGLTGKAYTAATRGAAVPLAVGVGSGEQAQRIALAREQGIDVSEGQEDLSILGGGFVGLSELASVSSLLSRIDKTKAGDGFIQEIKRRLGSAVRSGLEEGTQEVLANIAQDAIERGVYNENLQSDMSLKGLLTSDEFTIGGASGFAVDLVLNSIGNKRNRFANDAERDFEAGLRDKEAQEIAEIEQNVAEFETAEQEGLAAAESVQNLARSLQLNEPTIIPSQFQIEDWNALADGTNAGTTVGPRNIANEAEALNDYGNQIQADLNSQRKFPKSGRFTRGVGQATQVFYDPQDGSEMIPVSQELATPNQAGQLVGILEEKRQDRAINSQISRIIRNNETELDQPRVNTLAAWGRSAMNPKVGLIPRTRVDSVFNTTDISKGYQENLTSQEAIDAGATLTASQQINKKRREKDPNAQDKNAFSVEEIKAAFPDSDLGEVSISAEEDITYQVIGGVKPTADPKNLRDRDYVPYKVQGFNRSGEPVGNPFDAPVKFDSTGKIIPPTPDEIAATNFDRARPEIKAKTPFIITKGKNKGKPATDKASKQKKQREDEAAANKADAQAFADQLNADRSYLFKEADSATTEVDRNKIINNTLQGKNVSNSYSSPEIQVYVQNAIGRKPPSKIQDLSKGEFRLVTKKLASLPRFNSPTKIPLFTMEEASRNRQSIQPASIAVEPQPQEPVKRVSDKRAKGYSDLQSEGYKKTDVTYSDGSVYKIFRNEERGQSAWFVEQEDLLGLTGPYDNDRISGIGLNKNEALERLDELHARRMAKLAAPQVVQPDTVAPQVVQPDTVAPQEEVFLLPAPAPVEEVAPAEVSTALNKLRTALRSRLDKFGLKNIGVSIEESLERAVRTPDGRLIFGKQYDTTTKSLIDAQPVDPRAEAVFDPDTSTIMFGIDRIRGFETMSPQEQEDAMASILDHEMLHAMRRLDLFTEQEYQILVDQVTKQTNANGQTYLQAAQELYEKEGPVVQVEEAIAELTRDARANQRKVVGKPKALLNRILRFMTSLKNAINGLGFDSFDALIGRIEGGEIGRRKSYAETRDIGDVRDLVLTDLKGNELLQDVLATGRGATGADEREDRGTAPARTKGKGQTQGDFEVNVPEGVVYQPPPPTTSVLPTPEGNVSEGVVNMPPPVVSDENIQITPRDKLVYSRIPINKKEENVSLYTSLYDDNVPAAPFGSKTIPQLVSELQQKALKTHGKRLDNFTDQEMETIAKVFAAEAERALQDRGNATEWYKQSLDDMMSAMSIVHPELATDITSIDAFKLALAITSNGQPVETNIGYADEVYRDLKRDGKFPIKGFGKESGAMEKAFAFTNDLIDEYGLSESLVLLQTDFTVGDLQYMGFKKPDGEAADSQLPLSIVFGPKVGGAFFPNLVGRLDLTTMDRWFMRTWGRITGTLLDGDPATLNKNIEKFKTNLTREKAVRLDLDYDDIMADDDVLIAAAKKVYNDFSKNGFKENTEENRAARSIQNIIGGNLAPKGAVHRAFIRKTMNRATDIMRENGIDIDAATLQALVWYPEQGFYRKSGIRTKEPTGRDYGLEAQKIASSFLTNQGITDAESQRTIQSVVARGRRESPRRSGYQESGQKVGRGLKKKEQRKFVKKRIVDEVRRGLRGKGVTGTISSAFTRRTPKNTKFHLSQDQGVTRLRPLNTFAIKGNSRAANSLKRANTSIPVYHQLDNKNPDHIALFEDAITESKKQTIMGSSVFQYSPEEYSNMRLFVAEAPDTRYTKEERERLGIGNNPPTAAAGFAIKPDGDIVSVFKNADSELQNTAIPSLILAAQQGGKKLDAFDTFLPHIYSLAGFKPASRLKWDDSQAPDGWSKQVYGSYNNGEPDVVFMVYDPDNFRDYNPEEGEYAEGNDYDLAVQMQQDALELRNVGLSGKESAKEFLSTESQPRDNVKQIPQGAIDQAVEQTAQEAQNIPVGEVPFYNPNADPRSQYIARNPDQGSKPRDKLMYSRNREPEYNPEARSELDRLVDAPIPNQTSFEAYLEATDQSNIGVMLTRLRAAAINKYARLEDIQNQNYRDVLADSSAFAAALQTDKAKGVTSSAYTTGHVVYRDGFVTVDDFTFNNKKYRGLIDVMSVLMQNEYGVNLEKLAQAYAIAKRSEKLRAKEKDTPATEDTLANLQPEINKYINRETGRPIVEEWFDVWQAYNNKTIEFLVDTGVLAPEMADEWEKSAYVPFYRQAEEPDAPSPYPSVFKDMTTAAMMKQYKGSEKQVTLPLLESITRNLHAAIDMGMKNVAQQRIVRDQVNLGLAREVRQNEPAPNVVKFKVDGKTRSFSLVDPLLFESMQSFGDGPTGLLTQALAVPATVLRELITRDPGFMAVNMLRDTLSTYVTSGAKFTPVISTLKNFNADISALERSGVIGGYDIGTDSKNVFKDFQKEVKNRANPVRQFVNIWDFLGRQTTKSDAATRKAVYDDVLARTGNEAEANFQAQEVINYSRRGGSAFAKVITAAIPFLNARFQGLDVLYRAGKGTYTTRKGEGFVGRQGVFMARGLTLVALTGLYYALVGDDEQYKQQKEYVKDQYWIIPGVFGLRPLLIPIPFEVGLLFKTLPERILATFDGESSSKESTASAMRNLTSTLEVNPFGVQATAPLLEVFFNYNFHTGNNIEPVYMANSDPMEKALRQRVGTTQLAIEMGRLFNKSPIMIDHVLQGYGGTLGTYGIFAVDSLLRNPAVVGDDATQRPTMKLEDYPLIKRFVGKEIGGGLKEDYYEMREEARRFQASVDEMIDRNDTEMLRRYLVGREHMEGMADVFNYRDKQMKIFRDERNNIFRSTKSPDQKAKEIKEIDSAEQQFLLEMSVLKPKLSGPYFQAGNLYRD
jgi:hypothetical protein